MNGSKSLPRSTLNQTRQCLFEDVLSPHLNQLATARKGKSIAAEAKKPLLAWQESSWLFRIDSFVLVEIGVPGGKKTRAAWPQSITLVFFPPGVIAYVVIRWRTS